MLSLALTGLVNLDLSLKSLPPEGRNLGFGFMDIQSTEGTTT